MKNEPMNDHPYHNFEPVGTTGGAPYRCDCGQEGYIGGILSTNTTQVVTPQSMEAKALSMKYEATKVIALIQEAREACDEAIQTLMELKKYL